MKMIKTLYTFLLTSVIMIAVLVNFASTAAVPTIKVVPENIIASVGTSFTVQMWIYGAAKIDNTDVAMWQVFMTWDPLILEMDLTVVWGSFYEEPRIGLWGDLTADAAAGQKVVNVVDGFKYVSGYDVVIQDDSSSETNTVASVVGNQLTMQNDLANTYTVSANGGAYPIPDYTPSSSVRNDVGRFIGGQTTNGPAPGQSGDGWLCSFTFDVIGDGETTLNIDEPFTLIQNTFWEDIGDEEGELIKESGHLIYAWLEDLNSDGAVDIFDLSSIALHFGETGTPGWIPEDIVEDGAINVVDLQSVALKFGVYAGE